MARVPKNPPTWREQHDRMLRWKERIQSRREPDLDECYAFFASCYHLKDWLKNDPAVPVPDIREEVEKLFDRIGGELELKLAADLATGVKHLVVRQNPRRSRLVVVQVGDVAYDVRQVIDRCLEIWERFLSKHSLITP